MDRDTIINILRSNEEQLKRRGVSHIALFGSAARGDTHAASDIDLLVDIDPAASVGVFEYVGIAQLLENLLPAAPIDLTNRATLKPYVRPSAERDAIHAF